MAAKKQIRPADDPLSLFHPVTADWFRPVFDQPTSPRRLVDEIHAVVPTKRGAHLALSLERLEAITQGPVQRIGLSATQRPLEEVAHFLAGACIRASRILRRHRLSSGHHRRRQRTEKAGSAH